MLYLVIVLVAVSALKDTDICSQKLEYSKEDSTYEYVLSDLPYSEDFLEPQISSQIVYVHHSKHQQSYVDKLNKYLEDKTDWQSLTLVELQQEHGDDSSIQKYAGGVYNHELYWWTMTSAECSEGPSGDLLTAIQGQWGDFEQFRADFNTTAKQVFGSGWTWLCVSNSSELLITRTANQVNPLMSAAEEQCLPILGVDLWEHAYYLEYMWDRDSYITSWWEVVDWSVVESFYSDYATQGEAVSFIQS
jgi:Fe-Mn family superoxide dismutase